MEKKSKVILAIVIVLSVIGAWTAFSPDKEANMPLSAENMTVQERSKNDETVLLNDLRTYDVERVEINYSVDAIKLYLTQQSTAQYIDDKVEKAINALDDSLLRNKSDLTLEKESYYYYIYSKDGRLLETKIQ